jgi:cellulose synthase (UDP-forming)
MTRGRLRAARLAALAAVGGGAMYLFWRAGQVSELGVPAVLFFVAELVNYLALVVAVILFWNPYRRPAPGAPPAGEVDVFIPVCGEDVDMVEATVLAALAIDWPHETIVLNDGLIAGAANWWDIEVMCAQLGVRCLTRQDGARGKAGNLNAALTRTSGDFIVCLDADHLARPELGELLLGHFEDPRIAFVASRQSFKLDRGDALGHQEALFYRAIQPAKDRDNAAFSCGNGVAYRRAAIESVGGFSEWNIVEDLHTSFELHARGWRSAYVGTPVSVGTAPSTAAEMANQRLRWATDSLRMFFFDNPLLKRGLTMRQRLHYLHTTGWYLVATTHLVFLSSPIISILGGVRLLAPGTETTYGLLLAMYLGPVAALLTAHVGWRAALRTAQLQTFLAPVFALAVPRALLSAPSRRRRAAIAGPSAPLGGEVTRKSSQRQTSWITLFHLLVLGLLLLSVGVAIGRPGEASWAVVVWACILAVSLATPSSMLGLRRESTQSLRIAITAPAVCAALLVALSVWSTTSLSSAKNASATAAAPAKTGGPTLAPPKTGAYLGVYNADVAGPPQRPLNLARYPGAQVRLVHRFQAWWGPDRFLGKQWLDAVTASGGVPMITWEPWKRNTKKQPKRVLRQIANGKYDAYIRKWARDAVAYGRPMVLRLMHEMNGTWYPWSPGVRGNTASEFKAAWRHIHDIFGAQGATNVSWQFSVVAYAGDKPTTRRGLNRYYPGSRYVDWVGISGFNWDLPKYGAYLSYEQVFRAPYNVMKTFKKPIIFSEVGTGVSATDRSPAWVRDALSTTTTRFPRVKAIVWFDARHAKRDFTLRGAALESFREEARRPDLRPAIALRARG